MSVWMGRGWVLKKDRFTPTYEYMSNVPMGKAKKIQYK